MKKMLNVGLRCNAKIYKLSNIALKKSRPKPELYLRNKIYSLNLGIQRVNSHTSNKK